MRNTVIIRLIAWLFLVCGCCDGSLGWAQEQGQAHRRLLASESVQINTLAPGPTVAQVTVSPPVPVVDKGDVAWMLTATMLVLLMALPGLALFYGGMVRGKNVLSVFIQVATSFALIAILWVAYGYSFAFSGSDPWLGNSDKLFLAHVNLTSLSETFTPQTRIYELIYVAFQLTFAGITGALIVGAFAERIRFAALILFTILWFTFGYIPLAHLVWSNSGYLYTHKVIDFAGGMVVHINAGIAGLVSAYCVGPRLGYGRHPLRPHQLPFTLTGACLLWVGWLGFNAGSALEANAVATLALLNSLLAAAAGLLMWSVLEHLTTRRCSALGIASGLVAGLVGITPAAGTVGPLGAVAIGFVTASACIWGVTTLKRRLGADDTLDVFGIHGIGGIVGAVLTGVFTDIRFGGTGYASDMTMASQLKIQLLSVGLSTVGVAVISFLAMTLTRMLVGLRVSPDEEHQGLDRAVHGGSAYDDPNEIT